MNVLLVDDHPLFREGLRSLLERMEVKARFATTPVVIVSASYEASHVKQAIDRGARPRFPDRTAQTLPLM